MAHPNKTEGVKGHNDKLKRMTRDYGAADPSMNKLAPMNRLKANGPEEAVGFGAEYDAPTAKADRPARRSASANPVATYKRGGRIKHERAKAEKRAGGGQVDTSGMTAAQKRTLAAGKDPYAEGRGVSQNSQVAPRNPYGSALENLGGKAPKRAAGGPVTASGGGEASAGTGSVIARARGGRTRKPKPATTVNIIVAPQGSQQPPDAAPGPLPLGGNPAVPPPPPMPPAGPPGPMPAMGKPGGPPIPPGAIPPGVIPPRKHGGRVRIGLKAGADSGPGRLEKSAARARRQSGDAGAEI